MSTTRIDEHINECRDFENRARIMRHFIQDRVTMVGDVVYDIKQALKLDKYDGLPPTLKWTQARQSWDVMPWMGNEDGYIGFSQEGRTVTYVARKDWFTDFLNSDDAERMVKEEFRQASIRWNETVRLQKIQDAIHNLNDTIARAEKGERITHRDVELLFTQKRRNELLYSPEELLAAVIQERDKRLDWVEQISAYLELAKSADADEWYAHMMTTPAAERQSIIGRMSD